MLKALQSYFIAIQLELFSPGTRGSEKTVHLCKFHIGMKTTSSGTHANSVM
jgi:hypothetical protein